MTDRFTIMGVVNVTPDSFSDGGRYSTADAAISHGLRLVEEGADILDVGGESTRPGAETVPEAEEFDRVLPVIEGLAARTAAKISVDTRKPNVARAAVAAGAVVWNDVSALAYAEESPAVAAELGCAVVLMHAQGSPETMQADPRYDDVVGEVSAFLKARMAAAEAAGVARENLIVDPGIGFGKTLDHNLALLRNLSTFQELGAPVLLGASRKRFIAALDRDGPASARVGGSLAAVLAGAQQGVQMFRVHDVAETRQALAVFTALSAAGGEA